jgi:hypothetical protein
MCVQLNMDLINTKTRYHPLDHTLLEATYVKQTNLTRFQNGSTGILVTNSQTSHWIVSVPPQW